jgi:predicted RNA-binding Zn-ribbon protein involved in translation (DUF1610 family)
MGDPKPDWYIEWRDGGRDPQSPPNPSYPQGIDMDASDGASVTCQSSLVYPAPRCGAWIVRCRRCGTSAAVTTAGRPDDPRSLKLACRKRTH